MCGAAVLIFTESFRCLLVVFPHKVEQVSNHREQVMGFLIRTVADQSLELLEIWHFGIAVRIENPVCRNLQICNQRIQLLEFRVATPCLDVEDGALVKVQDFGKFLL